IHFDISNFKLFNERYGFRLGDELLCEVARTLHDVFSEGTVARFSDDHFVVCVTSGANSAITDRVENVQRQILQAEEATKRARLKAGIYYLEDTCSEVGLACDHARLACNSVKNRHDINYCIYDDSLRERLRKQQYVLDHIDSAIKNDDIKVYYQPVIRVATNEICGYEALVRWIDDTVGFLSPADFIDTLEQFHLIHKLDSYVIEKVCEDYHKLKAKGLPLVPVSVNLSRLDFELCDIFSIIENTRQTYGVPMNMLDLEITESALNDNSNFLKLECEHLHDLGYSIWIDDFGSGYSSLNTLTEYPFDVLKLDLVFLRSYDKNKKAGPLIEYIVKGALGMGISPLIEGVETKEHFDFLKKIGCVRAQGYHFSKPQPLYELIAYMEDKGFQWEKN
ncbi:MAG: EAL domain-containing protein, partial [Lachnospiraceae bacterium]|nr:EAL domain-containing protein [Lachnospiraceae bacterium]